MANEGSRRLSGSEVSGRLDDGITPTKNLRVYVGNLAFSVEEDELRDYMAQAGNVIRVDIFRDRSGRHYGCGLVEYETAEDAQNAIATLHNSELNQRQIFVREDREQGDQRGPSGRGGRGGYGGRDEGYRRGAYGRDSYEPRNMDGYGRGGYRSGGNYGSRFPDRDVSGRQVFCRNLSYNTSWRELKDLFREAGGVVRADVFQGPDGQSRGVGTVLFETPQQAENAVARYDGYRLDNREIGVRIDDRAGGGGGGYGRRM